MFGVALALTWQSKVSLQYFQDDFIIRSGAKKVVARVKDAPLAAPNAVVFRKDRTFAVWDERGLTVRIGKRFKSYRLQEIATSPKVFDRDQIRENLALFASGKRSKAASALSGARRIGENAYFLVRWEDSPGKPWLEALVRVDLTEKAPAWHYVGKFEGYSTAKAPIEDKLWLHAGSLTVVARRGEDWGESFYSSDLKAFGFRKLGVRLIDLAPNPRRSTHPEMGASFVEKTAYGTYLAGTVDLETAKRTEILESWAPVQLIDQASPMLALIGEGDHLALRNGDSGVEMALPSGAQIRRTTEGLLVWTPSASPTKAWLYRTEDFAVRATWSQAARSDAPSDAGR